MAAPAAFGTSDDTLVLSLPVTFDYLTFTGERKAFLLASDGAATSGWKDHGTYTILPTLGGTVGVSTLLPDCGTATSKTLPAMFAHGGGAGQHYLGYMLFLRSPNVVWCTAKDSCLVEFNRISDAQCSVNVSGL